MVVFRDAELNLRVQWNGSATFNVEVLIGGNYVEVDVFTKYDVEDEAQARQVAAKHIYEDWSEL